MKFSEIVDHASALLERKKRISHRALRREFELDDETFDDLLHELTEVLDIASNENSTILEWCGADTAQSTVEMDNKLPATPTQAERRQITVMFCDLVGSTELSNQLDPEELRELMVCYQQCAGAVVKDFGGHVAQYLGDGLMIYYGWPIAQEDSAIRAVQSSSTLINALAHLPSEKPLQVRIGIATGLVVVGKTGDGDAAVPKLAVGETPNLAARLQSLANPNEIIISPTTKALTGNTFSYDDLGQRSLKGILEPIRAWRVKGQIDPTDRFASRVAAGLTPLVGRKVEMSFLLEHWAVAKESVGQAVLLSGEAGIGKSRLTQALREKMIGENYYYLGYQCSPYHSNTAFHPIIKQIEQAVAFDPNDPVDLRLDKVEKLIMQGTPDLNLDERASLMANLLSLPNDRYPPLDWSPQRHKEKTYEVLADQVVSLAKQKPVLMVFEDAHWVDPTTLEVLSHAVKRLQDSAVLLIVTCRPEFKQPWNEFNHVTEYTLKRFSRRDGEQMIAEVTKGVPVPQALSDAIFEKTDGVPLFLEELTKTILESQSALSDTATNNFDVHIDIPTTLHDSLMSRLDRLQVGKEIAQLCACIGRDFDYEIVESIADVARSFLTKAFDELVSTGLLYLEQNTGHDRYVFKHALIQETAYQSLLKSRRSEIHRRIAEFLHRKAKASGDASSSDSGLIAHHYAEANDYANAIPMWLSAGKHAAQRSANVEAISHFSTALDQLFELPENKQRDHQELSLQMALGTARMVTNGFADPEIEKNLARASELCEVLNSRSDLVDVLVGLWAYHVSGQSPLPRARHVAEQLLSLAQQSGDSTALLKAHIVMSINLFYQGEFSKIPPHLDECLRRYDREQHHEDFVATSGYDRGVVTHCWVAMTQWMLGFPDQAAVATNNAIAQAQELGHPYTTAVVMAYSAWVHRWRGECSVAAQYADSALKLSNHHGFNLTWGWGSIWSKAGAIDCDNRQQEVVDELAPISKFRRAGIGLWMPHLLGTTAEIQFALGYSDNALDLLEEGIQLTLQRGDQFYHSELLRLNGEFLLTLDSKYEKQAEEYFRQAIAVAANQGAKGLELRATTSLAKLWSGTKGRSDIRNLLAPIIESFSEGHTTRDLQSAISMLTQ